MVAAASAVISIRQGCNTLRGQPTPTFRKLENSAQARSCCINLHTILTQSDGTQITPSLCTSFVFTVSIVTKRPEADIGGEDATLRGCVPTSTTTVLYAPISGDWGVGVLTRLRPSQCPHTDFSRQVGLDNYKRQFARRLELRRAGVTGLRKLLRSLSSLCSRRIKIRRFGEQPVSVPQDGVG